MNEDGLTKSCIFITQALARVAKFAGLNRTDAQVLIAVRSLGQGSYDDVARCTGINAQTLRSSATSPLAKLVGEELLTTSTERYSNQHKRTKKMFRLTETGEDVVHCLITGTNKPQTLEN